MTSKRHGEPTGELDEVSEDVPAGMFGEQEEAVPSVGNLEALVMADQEEFIRGKNVVAVISFHETSIYPTDASPGERPERLVASDPRGRFQKAQHHAGNPRGIYEADSAEYWRKITESLAQAGSILLLGHGKGHAHATRDWLAYAEKHRQDVAAKVVADIRVDLDHLDDEQILRLAQQYFGVSPPRDFGDARRGEPGSSS